MTPLDSPGASVDRLSVRRTPQHRHPRTRTRRLECHNCGEPHYVVDKETGLWSCDKDPHIERLASNLQNRVDRSKNPVLTKRCKDTLQVVIAVKSKPAVASDSNAAIGAASNPPNRNARHQSLCTNFVRDAVAFRFVNLKHVATENQFADVFTKAPTAPMLRLLKTLMNGAARIPLLARLYQ